MNNHIKSLSNGDFEVRPLEEAEVFAKKRCWCHACRPITMEDMRMVLCPNCGNKRCPKATDHRLECTGSNDAGQVGSIY